MSDELKPHPAASVDREALVNVIYDALDFDMTGRGTAVEIAHALIAAGMVNRPEAVVRDAALREAAQLLRDKGACAVGETWAANISYQWAGQIEALRTTPSETAGGSEQWEAIND